MGAPCHAMPCQVVKKYTSKRSKRKRTVGKNMLVIEALNEYLPAARAQLDKGAVGTVRRVTGFKEEVRAGLAGGGGGSGSLPHRTTTRKPPATPCRPPRPSLSFPCRTGTNANPRDMQSISHLGPDDKDWP